MPPVLIEDVRPKYVPDGFTLRSANYGDAWEGFYGADEQIILEYVRGSDFTWPLMVAAAKRRGETEFFGTGERTGAPIDINVSGAHAVYHDGIWAPGSGPDRRAAGEVIIHWQRDICHSVTARKANRIYAVRGSTATGVTVDELVKITRSLPFDG